MVRTALEKTNLKNSSKKKTSRPSEHPPNSKPNRPSTTRSLTPSEIEALRANQKLVSEKARAYFKKRYLQK
jgi:hypothetical protein